MNKKILLTFWVILAVMIVVNIKLYVSSIGLASDINYFDKEIKKLKTANILLETKLYSIDSLRFAQDQSSQLGFTKKSQPLEWWDTYAYNH